MTPKFKPGDIVRFTGDNNRRNDFIADSEADLLDGCRTHGDCNTIYAFLNNEQKWKVTGSEQVIGDEGYCYYIKPAKVRMKKPLFVEEEDIELYETKT